MKHKLDIDTWVRREHYNFFRQFEEPFWGVCVNIDCTIAYRTAKETGASFFLYYLHKSLAVACAVEPFRYRIEGDEVYIYDTLCAGPTISRDNGTFGFAYIEYYPSFDEFVAGAQKEIERVKNSDSLFALKHSENIIHYSSLPWINFTSMSHARYFSANDCVPKISFGKMTEQNGVRTMPVSIHGHHALIDGSHVGQYVKYFQELMDGAAI